MLQIWDIKRRFWATAVLVGGLAFATGLGLPECHAQPAAGAEKDAAVVVTRAGTVYRSVRQTKEQSDLLLSFHRLPVVRIPQTEVVRIIAASSVAGTAVSDIVPVDCPAPSLQGLPVRQIFLARGAPMIAKLIDVVPDRSMLVQRIGADQSEVVPWADLEAIRRVATAPDVCLSPDAGGGPAAAVCLPGHVTQVFAGRTFEVDTRCPDSHANLALHSRGSSMPAGWGALLLGQPQLGLLRHGWVSVGDEVRPFAQPVPQSVLASIEPPAPGDYVEHQEYLVERADLLGSLRIPLTQAKRASVRALRLPASKPVWLKLDTVHRYLRPGQLAEAGPVRIVYPRRTQSQAWGWIALTAGLAATAIGAGVMHAEIQRPYIPLIPTEYMLGLTLAALGATSTVTGVVILGVTATGRHPGEK